MKKNKNNKEEILIIIKKGTELIYGGEEEEGDGEIEGKDMLNKYRTFKFVFPSENANVR